ncbi:MAG: winged helix DNA-binding domain-containing protein, partial [Anaerolineae bacterium]|nr:winged helix DNA-binding domain-containing protein [Anaerolineae bacterium]
MFVCHGGKLRMPTLSLTEARAVLLAAQGLAQPRPQPATLKDVRATIRQMHVLQIDTIHVVARSPYLVLWSRLGDYNPQWLDDLLADGHLFEYWAHAACFLPIEDFALYRPHMIERGSDGDNHTNGWLRENEALAQQIMAHIRKHGAVRSADFQRTDGKSGTWWNWKDEKIALEMLFNIGELMVARRHNFQRVYDLRERVLPGWDDARIPSKDMITRTFILNTVKALGVARATWVADYFRLHKTRVLPMLHKLVDEGALLVVNVEGWNVPLYAHPANRHLLENPPQAVTTTLLSPFDPVVWDRTRAVELFDFDYRIECYTPAPKRKYGYFTLPVLHRGALIGRLDAKAHRKEGRFEVKSI